MMLIRFALVALIALGLAGFGGIAWLAAHPPGASQAAAPQAPLKRTVLVAARPLQAGGLLKASDIVGKEIAAADAPAGVHFDDPAARTELSGAMIRRSLAQGEPFLPNDVLRPGDHGFLAAVLGAGMRATTIGVDAVTGTAGLIWPGDRVDLILTQAAEDGSPIGRRVFAETVLSDVRVIAIDQQLVQGAAPGSAEAQPARTVTLEVTPPEAERIAVASRLGRLSLAVRPAESASGGSVILPKDLSRQTATWASDVSPALRGTPANPTQTMRLFSGPEVKEFRF